MSKIAVIHFNPPELYPPVQNFLNYLSEKNTDTKLYVFTTGTTFSTLEKFKTSNSNVRIYRLGISGKSLPAARRYFNYVIFYLGCLFHLFLIKPARLLFFETISSYPAYLYKRFFNQGCEVLIHYHEYTSPQEYETGMKLTKYFHTKEHYLFKHSTWISHTNEYRMEQFVKDMQPVAIHNRHILPNYPPKSWYHKATDRVEMPVKVVFAGSLGIDTMYTKEFAKWVMDQNGKVIWDIYSYNISSDAKAFIESLHTDFICFKNGVNYHELPSILKNYHVGVILYVGHNENYIYNAPNKLFEYLDCGLDVWFPGLMKGTTAYITQRTYPKVIPLDFNHLNQFSPEQAISRAGYSFKQDPFFCEEVLDPLCKKLTDV